MKGVRNLIIVLLGLFAVIFLISSLNKFVEEMNLLKLPRSEIKVQVLNGTDIQGLARKVADYLRRKGFDVCEIGNADTIHTITVIIDRATPKKTNAKIVAYTLRQGKLAFEPDPLGLISVTIVIGKDFKGIPK